MWLALANPGLRALSIRLRSRGFTGGSVQHRDGPALCPVACGVARCRDLKRSPGAASEHDAPRLLPVRGVDHWAPSHSMGTAAPNHKARQFRHQAARCWRRRTTVPRPACAALAAKARRYTDDPRYASQPSTRQPVQQPQRQNRQRAEQGNMGLVKMAGRRVMNYLQGDVKQSC